MTTPATRRSERKRVGNTRMADLDSSPTQRAQPASKKRKANSQAPPRARARPRQKTPEEEPLETNEDTDDETAIEDDEVPRDAEIVIPHLTVSKEAIVMTDTHHNDKIEETYGDQPIQAFAKLCGKNWTYYVQNPEIYIGREQALESGEDPPPVHIDLGPSKVVSRTHAIVTYESDDQLWHLRVHGRNGVKVDDQDLRKGESKVIRCGTVIAVAGTEMLFQIPDQKSEIHQKFKDRVVRFDEELDDGGLHGSDNPPPYLGIPGPLYNGHPFSPYPPLPPGYPPEPMTAPVPAEPPRPVTPEPSPKNQIRQASAKKRTPPNRRGMNNGLMMESTEQIDYASDSSRGIKPSCSYASLITWAITSTDDQRLSLSGIYEWIKAHYSFYRHTQSGWQNSIRHNLSLNQGFYKVPRRPDAPGKGMLWALDPKHKDASIATANKNASKAGGRVSSIPGTPIGGPSSSSGFVPAASNGNYKTSPTSRTPPLSSYPPTQPESFTPTRGPQMQPPVAYTPSLPAYAPTQGTIPVLDDTSPQIPRRRVNGNLTASDSSPTLTSGAWAADHSMATPAPRQHNLNIPQPNTARLPTSHMADSSPAPFWRFDGNVTPAGYWPEISPMKANGNGAGLAFPSSSPPPMANGIESPTRKPRPPVFNAGKDNGNPKSEEEDVGIDITRGFEKISSFHEQRSSNASGSAP